MTETQGHPKGLYLLFIVEMAERFSYYGMRAIFVLFLVKALLMGKDEASQLYGSFTGLVYLTPLIGGYVSDRFWGNRRSIIVGGLVMALGQLLMFCSGSALNTAYAQPLMLIGLFFLISGNGFFKPNISTMIGQLYPPGDKRVDGAFTIFYMGINIGAFFSPLICGGLGEKYDLATKASLPGEFRWGFLAACIGMLLSIAIFLWLKDKYLVGPDGQAVGLVPVPKSETENVEKENETRIPGNVWVNVLSFFSLILCLQYSFYYRAFGHAIDWGNIIISSLAATFPVIAAFNSDIGKNRNFTCLSIISTIAFFFKFVGDLDFIGCLIFSSAIGMPLIIIFDESLTREERQQIAVIFILAFFVIFFWSAFEQAGASLTMFADQQTDRHILGGEMPASWFQSINPLGIVILAPLFSMLWGFLGKRNMEPSSPLKMAAGLALLCLGYIVIAFGVKGVDSQVKISMWWLVTLYLLHTMGELCLSPIGLSMVAKLAPARFASLLMGTWFLSNAAANKLAGTLSALIPPGAGEVALKVGEVVKIPSFLGFPIPDLYAFFMVFIVTSGVAAILLVVIYRFLLRMMHGVN